MTFKYTENLEYIKFTLCVKTTCFFLSFSHGRFIEAISRKILNSQKKKWKDNSCQGD